MINGQDYGSFVTGITAGGTGSVAAYGQAGDDLIQLVGGDDGQGHVVFPFLAALLGGDGNDTLDARAESREHHLLVAARPTRLPGRSFLSNFAVGVQIAAFRLGVERTMLVQDGAGAEMLRAVDS